MHYLIWFNTLFKSIMSLIQTVQTPFQWLQQFEQRARQKAKGLPRQETVQQIWRGIAFRLDNAFLVTALEEIREIIICPTKLARVPGAKSWVKGIANVRGTLLPVINLQDCLEGKPTKIESRTRLIVINQAGIIAGLVVDEVLGIKHFPEQSKDTDQPCQHAWLAPFANGLFYEEAQMWVVFDMQALAKDDKFLKAAL